MEKNYWLALALSMIVLMAYPLLLKKNQPAPQNTEAQTETSASAAAAQSVSATALEKAQTVIKAQTVPFSNPLYDLKFSTQGGSLSEIIYKGENIQSLLQVPLYLNSQENGIFTSNITNQDVDLSKAVFQYQRAADNVFVFFYEKAGAFKLTKTYTVESARPVIDLKIKLENLSNHEKTFPMQINYGLYYADSAVDHHVDVESVMFQEKVKGTKLSKILKKGFSASGNIEWDGLLKKYFALIVKPDWKILDQDNAADNETIRTQWRMEPFTVGAGAAQEKKLFIFAGPQRYETLKSLKMDFDLILSRGFFGLFKIWLLISLKFFNQFTHNFGFAVILLTIALKIIFAPLTHMSYESMRKMQAVQPKMKSIQERYKNDPARMNREVMELYRRNKVNPMGGCLPMLAQIPIFIAFYQVLNETIELKGAPFMLWITDLAEPDKLFTLPFSIPFIGDSFHLLPIFMALSMYWQQKLTPQASTSPEQAQVMKFMPLMMGVILYKMPSGLALYWFVNNMLTVGHQLIIKRMGDVILHHEDRE